MGSLQPCLDLTLHCLHTQEVALKRAQEISLQVPQPILILLEGLMDDAGLWHLFLPQDMVQILPALQSLHPAPLKKNCTSCHTNQHQMSCIFYPSTFVPRALPVMTDAGPRRCGLDPGVSVLDVRLPAAIMRSL